MNLILLTPGELGDDGCVEVDGARALHLLNVLKVAPGESVRIGQLDGPTGLGVVQALAPPMVRLRCAFENEAPPRQHVDLLLALPRPKVMRRLWAQLAAIGVDRIIITNAERVERNYFDAHTLLADRYRPLLIEGLQQARDTRLPRVSIHRQFKILVQDELDQLVPSGVRLVADPTAMCAVAEAIEGRSGAMPNGPPRIDDRVLLAVGPEGGWNSFELELLKSRGFLPVGMGPRTLRTDTACLALLALVHSVLVQRSEARR